MTKNRSIAIDGPAGAGKSTIAKEIAAKLDMIYVDTGAMYRAMAIYFLSLGLDGKDEAGICAACGGADVSVIYENGAQQLIVNGENVSPRLREEAVGQMASNCAVYGPVRSNLVELQRELADRTPVIMDGRDIGSVVLPNAGLKVYLTASVEERARRRYKELIEKGETCDIIEVEKTIADRDYQDMHRENSPLCQAEDAVLVDSSNMTAAQVVDTILDLYRKAVAE